MAAAQRLEDLVVWRLAVELRDLIIEISATRGLSRDWKLRDQMRGAAMSVAANIAEGFGRFQPRDFARFLHYANGSIYELRAHVGDAKTRGYLDDDTIAAVMLLCRRTSIAATRLCRYLETCPKTRWREGR